MRNRNIIAAIVGWLLAGCSFSLCLGSVAVQGAVRWQADGSCQLSSAELKVTVQPARGSMEVLDTANGMTWRQRAHGNHTPFSKVMLLTNENAIGFECAYPAKTKAGAMEQLTAWTELRLRGRQLSMRLSVGDTNTPLNAVDFLEPFEPSGNMCLVVPDFCDGHIYPCGLEAWPRFNLDSIRVLNLPMPWAGVVDVERGCGYLVIVDTPYDAQLKLGKVNGLRSPLVAWNGEKGRFGYARSASYCFVSSGGYVALAKAYRAHAQAEGLLVKLAVKAQSRTNISELYGAPVLWDFDHLLSDSEVHARGVTRAIHHVERWDGNPAGLTQLQNANRLGFVTEEYDYYLGGKVDGGRQHYQDYHIRTNECAVDPAGKILPVERFGLRCTEFYGALAREILPARLRAFPQKARYFDQITQNYNGHDDGARGGGSTDECWDPVHPRTRRQWAQDVSEFYRYAAEQLGLICGAELGKFYQVPYTELFHGMESYFWPWPDVTFPGSRAKAGAEAWDTYDRWALNPAVRVPLWQLVFHDCAVATWYPWDGNDVCYKLGNMYEDKKDCFNVLYGSPASFLVTGRGQSSYFAHPSRWLQSYRNTCKALEVLADKEMTSHCFLSADRQVQQTAWSDGTCIIANFGAADWTVPSGPAASQCLKQFGFAAWGPWGQTIRSYDPQAKRTLTRLRTPGYTFDDEQLSEGQPVLLAQRVTGTNSLRINVDALPGQTNVSFVIQPQALHACWDLGATHVFLCDAHDEHRIRELAFKRSGADAIELSGLSGWIVLDVVCAQPRLSKSRHDAPIQTCYNHPE